MLFITGLQSKCKFVNIWSEYIYILSLILNINTFLNSKKEKSPQSFLGFPNPTFASKGSDCLTLRVYEMDTSMAI